MKVWQVMAYLRSVHTGRTSSGHVPGEDLERFASEKLAEDELAEIAAHIQACEECHERWQEARWFASHYKSVRKQGDLQPEDRPKESRVEITETGKVKVL